MMKKRKESDILEIRINTMIPGIAGTVVQIRYKDDKACAFTVDPPNLRNVWDAIHAQLAGAPGPAPKDFDGSK